MTESRPSPSSGPATARSIFRPSTFVCVWVRFPRSMHIMTARAQIPSPHTRVRAAARRASPPRAQPDRPCLTCSLTLSMCSTFRSCLLRGLQSMPPSSFVRIPRYSQRPCATATVGHRRRQVRTPRSKHSPKHHEHYPREEWRSRSRALASRGGDRGGVRTADDVVRERRHSMCTYS